jgi:chorismate mutase
MQSNYTLSGDPLSLERIRSVLTRLEDTIIFGLIERAQFAHNPKIYQKGAFEELNKLGSKVSWLEWFLAETEAFHGASCCDLDAPPIECYHSFYWVWWFPLRASC